MKIKQKRCAAIVLHTPEGKILLQHRSNDAPHGANKWGCFGGQIEQEETAESAAKRESVEELGYILGNPRQFLQQEFVPRSSGVLIKVFYFAEEYDSSRELILKEGQGMGWFTTNEAKQLDLTSTARLLVEYGMKGVRSLQCAS